MFGIFSGAIEDVAHSIRWDSGNFAEEVTRRAAVLSELNIGPGSIVAIFHNGGAHFFADLFATWRLGAAAACLDSSLTREELEVILDTAKPRALLVRQGSIAKNDSVPVLDLSAAIASKKTVPDRVTVPDNPALVLFTSGTTGEPKGVVLSFRALSARLSLNIEAIGKEKLVRTLVTLPTHFGHGLIGNALTALVAGGDIVLPPTGFELAKDLGQLIDDYRITFMSSVPTFWRIARHSNPPRQNSLTRVHVGSSPLSTELWNDVAAWSRAEVVNCYGLTETANWVAGASSRHDGIATGLVGRPWGCTVAVSDDAGVIQPFGRGELLVKSPAMMSGYLQREDLTKAVLTDGWLRTGDRGHLDRDGRIWVEGRINEQINRSGFKIQPAEIDRLLERHPAVAEACVFAVPDAILGEAVGAAFRLVEGATLTASELQTWCLQRVRREAVPQHWFSVDAIPRTSNGKVNRNLVRRKLLKDNDGHLDAAADDIRPKGIPSDKNFVGATDSVHKALVIAWATILRNSKFDLPWSEAGGDSVNTLRLWLHLEEAFGVRLPLDVINPDANLEQIAVSVKEALTSRSSQTGSSDRIPVVFFLPPATGDLPALAQFRAAFAGKIRFVVIRYPSWYEMIRYRGGFNAIIESAVDQIRAQGQGDGYLLAGYSFGGIVASEVARRLMELGKHVQFVGLIDARLVASPRPREELLSKTMRRMKRVVHPQNVIRSLPRRLISALSSISANSSLLMIGRLAEQLPSKLKFRFKWELTANVRMKSLRRWKVGPQDAPTVLFRADTEGRPLDYGWNALCRQLVIVDTSGHHLELFNPSNRDVLCAKFLSVLDSAVSAARPTDEAFEQRWAQRDIASRAS